MTSDQTVPAPHQKPSLVPKAWERGYTKNHVYMYKSI